MKIKGNRKTVKDLFTSDELTLYNLTPYPRKVDILYKVLKAKVEEDPDYELWVPLTYIKYTRNGMAGEQTVFHDDGVYVSNKGNIHFLRKDTGDSKGYPGSSGYLSFRIRTKDGALTAMVNRLVCCCFIPVGAQQTISDIHELQVNHKDTIKINNYFTNLEWMTNAQNVQHAVDNGLRKYLKGEAHYTTRPLKGKVHIPGEYQNTEFIVSGLAEQEILNVKHSAREAANGRLKQAKGCYWAFAAPEEIKSLPKVSTLPVTLQDLIRNYDSNFKATIWGMNLRTGAMTDFIGTAKMREYNVYPSAVYHCINGRIPGHKGWVFLRELGDETEESIRGRLEALVSIYTTTQDPRNTGYRGFKRDGTTTSIYFGKKEIEAAGFESKKVYKCTREPHRIHKGYFWKQIKTV